MNIVTPSLYEVMILVEVLDDQALFAAAVFAVTCKSWCFISSDYCCCMKRGEWVPGEWLTSAAQNTGRSSLCCWLTGHQRSPRQRSGCVCLAEAKLASPSQLRCAKCVWTRAEFWNWTCSSHELSQIFIITFNPEIFSNHKCIVPTLWRQQSRCSQMAEGQTVWKQLQRTM